MKRLNWACVNSTNDARAQVSFFLAEPHQEATTSLQKFTSFEFAATFEHYDTQKHTIEKGVSLQEGPRVKRQTDI